MCIHHAICCPLHLFGATCQKCSSLWSLVLFFNMIYWHSRLVDEALFPLHACSRFSPRTNHLCRIVRLGYKSAMQRLSPEAFIKCGFGFGSGPCSHENSRTTRPEHYELTFQAGGRGAKPMECSETAGGSMALLSAAKSCSCCEGVKTAPHSDGILTPSSSSVGSWYYSLQLHLCFFPEGPTPAVLPGFREGFWKGTLEMGEVALRCLPLAKALRPSCGTGPRTRRSIRRSPTSACRQRPFGEPVGNLPGL